MVSHKRFILNAKNLYSNWLNALGLLLVTIALFTAVFGDLLVPYSPIEMDLAHRLEPPSSLHIFGTDEFGRDILSRVVAGAKISLQAAFMILIVSAVTGFIVGCVAGLLGGWVDEVLMRVTDMFLAFPTFILAMAVVSAFGPSLRNTLIALSIVYWPNYVRVVRVRVLSLKEREYIMAAVCVGVRTLRLIVRHLLPNVLPILITQLTLDVGYVILSISALSFLGLGAQPPKPEWGAMIMDARNFIHDSWWFAAFPGLALALTCIGFNLLGDGLRNYLDPRLHT